MHEVGQIIFLVSRKAQSVLAAQICEQNVKKTLDGEETTFRVRIGTEPDMEELYDLDRIDADIYGSPEEATESLYSTAKLVIDSLVDEAVKDATSFFDYKRMPPKKTTRSRSTRKTTKKTAEKKAITVEEVSQGKSDDQYVTMPDGTQAKLKTPIDNISVIPKEI